MNDSQKLLAGMSESELENLILRLGRYSERECKRLKWRTNNIRELSEGETVDSVVSKAFERVLSGQRIWKQAAVPDFAKYMMDVIDSLLSHMVNSKDNTSLKIAPEEGSSDEPAWNGYARKHERKYERDADWMSRKQESPEELLIHNEQTEAEKHALVLLEKSIKEDAELITIVQAIREGCNSNGEIVNRTGIAIRDVEKAKKRLDRRIANVNKLMINSEYSEFTSESRRGSNGHQ